MASVHYDQLENTSLKNAKIDGYPSLLLVGQDKKPATFNNEYGTTNALPNSNNMATMKSIVTSPKANTVSTLNTSNATNFENENTANSINANTNESANSEVLENVGSVPNLITASNNVAAVPPNVTGDEVIDTPLVRTSNQGATPLLRGGRLYRKLSSKRNRKSRRANKKTRRGKRKN